MKRTEANNVNFSNVKLRLSAAGKVYNCIEIKSSAAVFQLQYRFWLSFFWPGPIDRAVVVTQWAGQRLSQKRQSDSLAGRAEFGWRSNIGHSWASLAGQQRAALFVLPSPPLPAHPSLPAPQTAKIRADDPTGMLGRGENTNPFWLRSSPPFCLAEACFLLCVLCDFCSPNEATTDCWTEHKRKQSSATHKSRIGL